MTAYYRGKPIDEMTREELIEALTDMQNQNRLDASRVLATASKIMFYELKLDDYNHINQYAESAETYPCRPYWGIASPKPTEKQGEEQ
jgi:hypothetical protein